LHSKRDKYHAWRKPLKKNVDPTREAHRRNRLIVVNSKSEAAGLICDGGGRTIFWAKPCNYEITTSYKESDYGMLYSAADCVEFQKHPNFVELVVENILNVNLDLWVRDRAERGIYAGEPD